LIIANKSRRILYINKSYKGKEHDYSLLKAEFPPETLWFAELTVRLDLGFQGFPDLYPSKELFIPIKRKRVVKGQDNTLTPEQKAYNKATSQDRIYVEHSIGGMKRYQILVHRNRIKSEEIIDQVIGVCAGLWNYNLANSL